MRKLRRRVPRKVAVIGDGSLFNARFSKWQAPDTMSASILNEESNPTTKQPPGDGGAIKTGERPISELSDLVDIYAVAEYLPPADWVTRLNLVRPRRDVLCLSGTTRFFKRSLDIVVSLIMIVLLAPVLVLTALAVRLTSPGSVIFRQQRVGLNLRGGKDTKQDRRQPSDQPVPESGDRRQGIDRRAEANYGKPFTLYKFRTMRTDAEKNGAQFATKGDPRVTSIGRFLRKTRLDELPQLWNVLKGEMTLVGPRPERPEFMQELSDEIPNYLDRLGLKPGLTGPAQVINGYDNNIESFRRKVALDLLYLQNCCLWNDIKILFRTIRVVLTGSGAL
jgi:lipopolysaccharide/colanic/teichoic acid biosynthesis glycosyltransferase